MPSESISTSCDGRTVSDARVARTGKDGSVSNNALPLCNRVAALVKRWLVGTDQGAGSYEHLDYYLDEYSF